ncbi:hypothetical protein AGMMS50225_04450 [Betaproteobacteria bacterium]|nr:hypothetical protein AGMMS50225_04450 [Betaproteobacteria bacterium]
MRVLRRIVASRKQGKGAEGSGKMDNAVGSHMITSWSGHANAILSGMDAVAEWKGQTKTAAVSVEGSR